METGGILLEEEKDFRRQYRYSSWWINHQQQVRRLALILFGICDAALLTYALANLTDAFLISYQREQRAVAEMVAYGQPDLHAYTQVNAAQDLDASPVTTISSGQGKYDLYAELTNTNDDWWAEVTYRMRWADGETEPMYGFILPNETKPFAAFAITSATAPRSSSLVLDAVVWHRVDHAVTGAYEPWAAERLDFEIKDITFAPSELDPKIGHTTFTVTNRSPYSYYEPTFYIVFERGSNVVGVTRTIVSSLDAGESQMVSVNWFGTLPNVSKVEIIPEVHVFDLNSYKPLQGESSTDTRTRVFSTRR